MVCQTTDWEQRMMDLKIVVVCERRQQVREPSPRGGITLYDNGNTKNKYFGVYEKKSNQLQN